MSEKIVGFGGDGIGYRMEGRKSRKSRKRAKCRRLRQFPGGVDSNGGGLGNGSSSGLGDGLVYRMERRKGWKRAKCRRLCRFTGRLTAAVGCSGRAAAAAVSLALPS